MMTDEKLLELLRRLGLEQEQHRLVGLLPLVEVAWSDGSVHEAERGQILEAAASLGFSSEGEQQLLLEWLSEPPSAFFLDHGRRVVQELVRRGTSPVDSEGLLALCFAVASSAGGLFGFGAISAQEREAIGRLAQLLRVPADLDWRAVLQDP